MKWFIVINAIGISISTALNAIATEFWGILYPRCLLAIFSAGIDPASLKLISLNFTPETRGIAYGFYLATVYVGSALASLTLLLSVGIGWQLTFLISGSVGLIIAINGIFTISNSKRIDDEILAGNIQSMIQNHNQKSDWTQIIKNKTLIFTLTATFFRYAAGFSRGYYEALYFSAQFPDRKSEYSIINAVALLLTPITLALAGKYSDIKEKNNNPKWRAILCSVTNIVAVPLLLTMYLADSFLLAMICLIIVYIIGETYISISIVMMMNVTLPRLRGLRNF